MAAGKSITSRLVIQLVNGVSGPARAVASSLSGINRVVQGMDGRVRAGQAGLASAIAANNRSLEAVRGRMLDAAAGAYVLARAISAPIDAAMRFESAMADVRKVVDFETPEAFKQFSDDLLELSTRVPVAVDGLAAMAAAAGQAGIAAKDILAFTEAAAKVSTAFDIDADAAGDALAKLMAGLGLTIPQVMSLADAMNHLSNAQASSAADILDVVRRVGATATQFGFNAEQVAAFASAMVAAGADSEVAATSFRNMGLALARGESATKRQRESLAALGLEAEDVAKRMQQDAVGTTLDVLERIGRLPEEMRAAVSYDLFGGEARALGPLITNLDLLRQSLGLIADEMQYAGSTQREFGVRSETAANALQIFQNRLNRLSIRLGDALLPALTKVIDALAPFVDRLAELTARFPRLTTAVVATATGLIGLRIALMGVSYAGLLARGGLLALASPILGLAGVVTRLASGATAAGAAMAALAVRTRATGAATAATMAGMSLAGQNMAKAAKASKAASAAMIAGMGASAMASRRMVAGMSAASAASTALAASGGGIRGLGAAFLSILRPIALVRGALTLLKVAMISTGVGALLVAVGSAGAWIYQNWEGLGRLFTAFGKAFREALGPVGETLGPVLDWFGRVASAIGELFEPMDQASAKWAEWGTAAGTWAGEIVAATVRIGAAIFELPGKIVDAMAGLGSALFTAGAAAIQSLWDGMVSKFGELLTWVASIPSRIVSAIGSIDLSGMVKWPSLPSWAGGGGAKAPPTVSGASELPEARAEGGPVTAGKPYIVGDGGVPELFVPRQSGEIIPPDKLPTASPTTSAAGPLGRRAGPSATFNSTVNVTVGGFLDSYEAVEELARKITRVQEKWFKRQVDGLFADYGTDPY